MFLRPMGGVGQIVPLYAPSVFASPATDLEKYLSGLASWSADFEQTIDLLNEVQYDAVFGFQYSPRPNTPALVMIDSIPPVEKSTRLQVLLDRQREIQRVNYEKHLDEIMEVMVEGQNPARGQISGRSSQNKPVNFTWGSPIAPAPGTYHKVRISKTYPNSLVGEAVQG